MRTIDYTPKWTLRRPGCLAEVTGDVEVLLDGAGRPSHEVCVRLNGEVVYQRCHGSHAAAERDVEGTRRDLLAAGWRDDLEWCGSAALPPAA